MDYSLPGSCKGSPKDFPGKNTEGDFLPFPSPVDLPDPGIKPTSPVSPSLKADSLLWAIGICKVLCNQQYYIILNIFIVSIEKSVAINESLLIDQLFFQSLPTTDLHFDSMY